MLSSWQIAQMHGQQSQAFGQQQAFSQQISSRMPQPYQGLGATGFGGGFSGGGGFGYGGGGMGYGPGNSFGNSMTSAMGGIGNAIGSGMGIAGGLAGFKMGGFGGAMMGFAGGAMIGAGVKHVAGSFMEGAHEQAGLERTLSQFQFQNAQSRTGQGFSRSDSMQIGNMVRQMERMPEMLTSFGELNRVMDKMGQMGLMQGVRDAGEFMKKFRDTTTQLKDMAKMMGTTMEGALKAFGEARQSGFYNNADISRNVLQRQMVGSVTGMNQTQVGGLQMYGAELSHSLGGSRAGGARNMLRTAGQLGMANQMGILSNDAIMEMTGKEGAEGLQDLSGTMGQLSYKMGRSNVGQALTLALGAQKDGRYTGEMDQELVEKVRRGEIGLGELKALARKKASTRGAKLSFAAHKNRLRTEMSGAVGSEGIAMQLNEILGDRGWSNPDAQNLVMQRFGASEEQANLLQKMMPNLQDVGTNLRTGASGEARQQARGALMKEKYSWDAIKHRMNKKIQHYTTDWAKDLGKDVRDSFQSFADDFVDEMAGTYVSTLSKNTSNLIKGSMMGNAQSRKQLSGMISSARASGDFSKGAHLGRGGGGMNLNFVRRGMDALGGAELSGDQLKKAMEFMAPEELIRSGTLDFGKGNAANQQEWGNIVLQQGHFGGYTAVSPESIKLAKSLASTGSNRNFDRQGQLKSLVGDKTYQKAIEAMQKSVGFGGGNILDEGKQMSEAIRKAVGNDAYKKMMGMTGTASHGALISTLASDKQMEGYYGLEGIEGKLKSTLMGFDTTDVAGIARRRDETRKGLAKSFKSTDAGASFAELDKLMSEDSTFRNLLLGNDQVEGLLDGGAFSKFTGKGQAGEAVQRALKKNPDKWTPEEKAAAEKMGITAEWAKANKGQLQRIKTAIDAQGGDVKEAMKRLAKESNAGDLAAAGSQLKSFGERISGATDRYKKQIEGLSGGAKTAASKISELGEKLAGADGLKGVEMYASGEMTTRMGEITELISSADPKQKEALMNMVREAGLGEIDAQVSEYDRVMNKGKGRRGKGRKKSMDLSEFIKKDAFGTDDQGRAMYSELEAGLNKDGKAGVQSEEERKWLAKQLSSGKAADLMAKSGSTQQSKYMSEQEVAGSLKTLSENNLAAAQILKDLATGQAVGTTKGAGAAKS